jgi:class 3 adenylate cyclase/tetratricopeptide (TPR) repeat protein
MSSVTCPNCGQENPAGFLLCGMCGTPLAATAPAREERKLVTVLFCDLVGFTQRSEQMDPEDVRALLRSYHEHLRGELERFGGTVEKFIGDAVVAVFGAPVAHEDDPERAVRAALAIRDWAREQEGLELRIAVNTGEALVSLGADPARGEGMVAGDVVNTASRLQSAAPTNGILVGETAYRATQHAIDYREADPVAAKGKAEPVRVWEAVDARSRLGSDVLREAATPLVGRRREVDLLTGTLDRVVAERSPQLVTLVGVPGIGKSRLVYELLRHVEAGEELVTWRQGRSLPYGAGVAFWALGEIVKAQAGILESDTEETSLAKLGRAVADVVQADADAAWMAARLRPLVGVAAEGELTGDRRDEAFTAWRRFLEALAERRPLVLVFEDLHWADDVLLDFVDELPDWTSGVPLLVVGTARPELLDRRPGWGGGKLNATTLALSPLGEEETARLIGGVLERALLPAETQVALVERAGGNPLYAEQFARLYLERGSADDLPLPESLQGLIAARLDGLSAEEKGLLQNAAVVGKVFWVGALRRAPHEAARLLHSLERKAFVRRERRSAVEGQEQYAFAHVLVRDVAYGQIPRQERADKHRRAAAWIESLGRGEDHAEMVAHHYLAALDLARAAGRPDPDLRRRARTALAEAGDRALALNASPAAVRLFSKALDLSRSDDAERPELLFRLGDALHRAGDERRGDVLEEAAEALLAAGTRPRAAEAYAVLAELWWQRGLRERSLRHQERAMALVRDAPPSAAKARVLAEVSRFQAIGGPEAEALETGREALALAQALDLTELAARVLNNIGIARVSLGDLDGVGDVERSVELARSINSPEAVRGLNNMAVVLLDSGDRRRACELLAEAVREGERIGGAATLRHSKGVLAWLLWAVGEWDEALRRAEEILREVDSGLPSYVEGGVRRTRGRIWFARSQHEAAAVAEIERNVELGRAIKDPQVLLPALAGAARTYFELGRLAEARRLAEEVLLVLDPLGYGRLHLVLDLVIVAAELGVADPLRRAVQAAPRRDVWRGVAEAILSEEYEWAADLLDGTGSPVYAADARFLAARQLAARGSRAAANRQLEQAVAFWRSVGATRYLRESERLLAASA